uniref:G-protein coupled receptors family 1 profile domain-containing protein n=1 Tax=Lates calcarifer TaxID=8187 RepID=A0A4W6BY04_LATCA
METTMTPAFHNNATAVSRQNNSDEYSETSLKLKSLYTTVLIIYSLAFVLGVLENGVVIWVIRFKMKKTVNTVWFLNLAVADFLFAAFLPFYVTYAALDFHWPFGKFMCKLNSTMIYLSMFASVYLLVVISLDRCVSVVWPVWAKNHRNVRRASCVSLVVWVLALIFSTPYFIFRDTLRQFRYQAMAITRFLLGFAIPCTVIVSSYAVIIHRLRRNRTLATQSSRPFKIIAAIITTFLLCFGPFHITSLLEIVYFTGNESETLFHVIVFSYPIATSLAFLSSCLNPLLYVFMSQDFKDKVHKSVLSFQRLGNAWDDGLCSSHFP